MFLAGVAFLGHANELLALHFEQSDIRLGSSQVARENHQILRTPNPERKSISRTRHRPISKVEKGMLTKGAIVVRLNPSNRQTRAAPHCPTDSLEPEGRKRPPKLGKSD